MKYQAWHLLAGILVQSLASNCWASEIELRWLNENKSNTRQFAESIIQNSDLPIETTTILYDVDIQIKNKVVNKTVRQIRYFPKYSESQNSGNETIYWDQETENLTIFEAAVISAEQGYQRLDSSNIRVLDSSTYNTFTDQKEAVLPFSGLRDQSLLILEYQLTFKLSALESPWSSTFYPVTFEPVKKFNLQVQTDGITPIDFWTNSETLYQCTKNANNLQCKGNDLPAYQSDEDILWRDHLAQILVGEKRTWDEIAKHNLDAFDKSDNQSEEVKQLVEKLVRDAETLDDKIAALHEFVTRDVRYVSISELGHRITPHTSASVINNRFGDCKDKSALLQGMLQTIGVDAEPILVATRRSDVNHVVMPASGYFDHMVVCFKKDNFTYCLDPTAHSSDWKSIPSAIQSRVGLSLNNDANVFQIPQSKRRWRMKAETYLKFDSDGGANEKQKRTFYGAYSEQWRGGLSWRSEKERNEWLIDSYHSQVTDSVDPTFILEGVDELARTLVIKNEVMFEDYLDPAEELYYTEPDAWLSTELAYAKIDTQHYDAKVLGLEARSIMIFDFNNLWKLGWHSPALNLEGKYGSMKRTIKREGNDRVLVDTLVTIDAQTIKQSEIEAFNKYMDLLKGQTKIKFDGAVAQK